MFVSTPFRKLADSRKEALGMPDLLPAVIPHPLATMSAQRVQEVAESVAATVVALLTGER